MGLGPGLQLGSWIGVCLAIAAVWLVVILLTRSMLDGRPDNEGNHDDNVPTDPDRRWLGDRGNLGSRRLRGASAHRDSVVADTARPASDALPVGTRTGWKHHREDAARRPHQH